MTVSLLFALGSSLGWILELIYRRFFSTHKWINPGFLVGPYLPLYGFGISALFVLSYNIRFDSWFGVSKTTNTVLTLIIMALSMTLMEYIAGIIFIKGLGIKLWDYSDDWGNIQGIICPLYSFFWAVLAVVFYFFINPVCKSIVTWFSENSHDNTWLPFVLGMFYGVLFVDLCYSFKIASKISKFAKENKIIIKLEALREDIREFQKKAKAKISFVFPFKPQFELKGHLNRYLEKVKEKLSSDESKKNKHY